MKKKLKKLFYLSLLLSGLIIAGCELQEDVIEQHNHQHEIKLSKKRFSELLQDKNFTTAFSKIPKQKVLTTNVLGRTQMEDKYGFTIFDTPVNVMESDTLIAYNLLIKRDVASEGSYVENLVMNIFPQKNRTDAYIIKYIFDGTTEINPENFFELEKKHVVTPIIFNNEPFDEVAKQSMVCIRLLEFQCCILGGNYTKCHVPEPSQSCVGSWQTVDVLCTTSAGSGGGYDYSGVGGGPPDPHQGGSNGNGNTHPVYNNPAPPCDPRVNCPVLEDTAPCDNLKRILQPPTTSIPSGCISIKQAIENLQSGVTQTSISAEEGYNFWYNPTTGQMYANQAQQIEDNMVKYNSNILVFGGGHFHQDGLQPMFSYDDIGELIDFKNHFLHNIPSTNAPSPMHLLITEYGTYAIMINDVDIFTQQINSIYGDKKKYKTFKKNLSALYNSLLENPTLGIWSNDIEEYEEKLLKFINNIDNANSFGNLGVSLYRAKPNLTGWQKLNYTKIPGTKNYEVKPEDCL